MVNTCFTYSKRTLHILLCRQQSRNGLDLNTLSFQMTGIIYIFMWISVLSLKSMEISVFQLWHTDWHVNAICPSFSERGGGWLIIIMVLWSELAYKDVVSSLVLNPLRHIYLYIMAKSISLTGYYPLYSPFMNWTTRLWNMCLFLLSIVCPLSHKACNNLLVVIPHWDGLAVPCTLGVLEFVQK